MPMTEPRNIHVLLHLGILASGDECLKCHRQSCSDPLHAGGRICRVCGGFGSWSIARPSETEWILLTMGGGRVGRI